MESTDETFSKDRNSSRSRVKVVSVSGKNRSSVGVYVRMRKSCCP